eukprot:CAMPEP_0113319950 /NCGR_PEP_ID=MMETSP0010_2-20120614/13944_1 /TAXON_ID=216773 ORGANISM="Corethron hystrix, Strain 308" /NCGR_SAMPLE_ID=MMETSP0010_2 /ASSEMBLY_ACC=CAM_ASM_000155 /LENGTH=97 /DNA_ID=CAMNT_0000177615 /DNA_START=38 /DNA_END=331 /DNA_ORIENTATION=- /assembly_acc=CAM_ASM_000155
MVHISPWGATLGLFGLAGRVLARSGALVIYGPFKEKGTAVPSNLSFDEALRRRDPEWGVRDLEAVSELARKCGLTLDQKVEMPANNLGLVFRRCHQV